MNVTVTQTPVQQIYFQADAGYDFRVIEDVVALAARLLDLLKHRSDLYEQTT